MTLHVPRLPVELDPLIAEAKRRARARRFLVVAVALAAAGTAAATMALRSSTSEFPRPVIAAGPACRSAQLNAVPGGGGSAGGTRSQDFALVNVSNVSCTLRGWPGLKLVLGTGQQVTPRVRHDRYGVTLSVPVRQIGLRPGAAASFRVAGSDMPGPQGQSCLAVKSLLVSPPGTSKSLSVPYGIGSYCWPRVLYVAPFVSGRVDHQVGW